MNVQGHNKLTSISEGIKHSLTILTERYGISEAELCRKTNISQPTLNRLLTGTTDDPRASTLNEIAKFFNITLDQLLGNQPIPQSLSTSTNPAATTYLPVFTWENIADWRSLLKKISPNTWSYWTEAEPSIQPHCFAIKVIGESMWPQFTEGSLLIVDPTVTPKHRDYVLAFLQKKREVLFRQYVSEGSSKVLKPINTAFRPTVMTKEDKIIGVVLKSRLDLK